MGKRTGFSTLVMPFTKSCLKVQELLPLPGLLVNCSREEAWMYKKMAENLSPFPLSETHNYCLTWWKQMDHWKSPAGFRRRLLFGCIFWSAVGNSHHPMQYLNFWFSIPSTVLVCQYWWEPVKYSAAYSHCVSSALKACWSCMGYKIHRVLGTLEL